MKNENYLGSHEAIREVIKNINNLRDDLDEVECHLNGDNIDDIAKAVIYANAIFKCLKNVQSVTYEIIAEFSSMQTKN